MDVTPIPNAPALLIDNCILVVADLHIGIEGDLRQSGFILPSQTERLSKELLSIIEKAKPERLVILGDLKHNVPQTSRQERREIPSFLEAVMEKVKRVDILKGNHDGGLASVLPSEVCLQSSKGIRIGEIGLFHGHAWPSSEVMESETAIMAHDHPIVVFQDRLGMRTSKRCWVRTPFRKKSKRYETLPKVLILMPAFNNFCGGTPINDKRSNLLGPILTDEFLFLSRSKIHLLNGVLLGTLSHLMI